MLGFIATGLKLLGRIVVKIVKAVTIGTAVGVLASNSENIKETAEKIGDEAIKDFDKKCAEKCKDPDHATKKETIKMLPHIIATFAKVLYSIWILLLTIPLIIVDALLDAIRFIFKKEEK